ncbi:alanine/glycine:cation symporter family protein [Shewanella litorisediminis]|uniref:Alanine:cation symporter family protein n=1 Tax=Shewanella litorisediminis TaxID=1173586 RepID=A0ABX7G465_9GAMM|nr:amino acid carrier protein [Shewanella litorisediminis]MCL2920103.1 amino acid carrier protein [Shewanella litorisediminis]QRH02114.1 alanine:cation symporter family protein [Shewanella litorisediminis]
MNEQTPFDFASLAAQFAAFAWGPHMLFLLVGGGLFFLIYSGLAPFRYLKHAIDIVRGKYPEADAAGNISHAGALSSAMAGTVGMGNIGGVALAIVAGGPGAIFWMWVSALVGMATKFFTCTLAIMYRGTDETGRVRGGPMYIITHGLGAKWKPLAVFFCLVGLVGNFPLFNTNQLVQILKEYLFLSPGDTGVAVGSGEHFALELGMGLAIMTLVALVILGGIKRIAAVAIRVVPAMILLYVGCALYVIFSHLGEVPMHLWRIVEDAFSVQSVAGGILGTMLTGVKRAAFSNEAGIGTEVMVHGNAKTSEPVKEGLVAMLGPAIDTLLVCTATALIILISGVWEQGGANGISLSSAAFAETIPGVGPYLLLICVCFFAITTIFTQAFYGSQCFAFLFGARRERWYLYLYLLAILFAATNSLTDIVNIIDGAYGLMAIPTMTAALLLAPRVRAAAKDYFRRLRSQGDAIVGSDDPVERR